MAKEIYVGGLGEANIDNKGNITAYYIEEEDGSKSWQLLVDENRGDRIIKSAYVIPIKKCKCGGTFRDKIMGNICESCGTSIELEE